MSYRDYLIRNALRYWTRGAHLPSGLFHDMLRAGLDVSALEREHMKKDTLHG